MANAVNRVNANKQVNQDDAADAQLEQLLPLLDEVQFRAMGYISKKDQRARAYVMVTLGNGKSYFLKPVKGEEGQWNWSLDKEAESREQDNEVRTSVAQARK